MTFYNEKLKNLQEKVVRKAHLMAMLEDMQKQKRELEKKVKLLEIDAHNEQVDVELLEGKTFSAFIQGILGKKEEKLEKERAEAYAAAMKRDLALRELDDLYKRIADCDGELSTLQNCDSEYQSALNEKLEEIKKSGVRDVDYMLVLEEKISYCDNQVREIDEAIAIAENVKDMASEALSELSSAEDWATFDVIGGGMIADIVKHDHMGNADLLMVNLKKELSKLKTELVDVKIDTDIEIHIGEFTEYADFFIDNIFVDFAVLDKIQSSDERLRETFEQIKDLIAKLNMYKSTLTEEKAKLQIERDML